MQYADGSELDFVRDQDEWDLDPARHSRPYRPQDRLIDSTGAEYRLVFAGSPGRGRHTLEPTGRRLDSREVQGTAERHLARLGAQPVWLTAHLADVAEDHRIRATFLYLFKLDRPDPSKDSQESES